MYMVPGLALMPQSNSAACWYASAQMLIQWKRNRERRTLAGHPDPSQVRETVAWEVARQGLVNPNIIRMATLLGLRTVPAMTMSLEGLEALLINFGPLWTNGQEHIVVIGGIDVDHRKVLVFDPWPPNVGLKEWRDFSWYLGTGARNANDPDSSRDTSPAVQATFLCHP